MRKTRMFLAVGLALLPACRAREKPLDVDQLVQQLRGGDPQKSGAARLELIRLGEPAVPAVSALLRSDQPADRLTAANTLWGMGARARAAVPELSAALDDSDTNLRLTSTMALQSMGEAAEGAVPALIKALGDRDNSVRQAAVKALGAIGPGARAALPTLTRALRRSSWPEAEETVRKIRRLEPGARIDLGSEGGNRPMSLAGRLEEVELPEILHFLSLNNRTGKLTLTRRDARGTVVVRRGRIVYAASSSIREALGSILLSRGLVSQAQLQAALESQHQAADGRKLGAILVETRVIGEEALREALTQQIGLVVQELCRWRSGYFKFEIATVAASGDIGVDAEDLVVPGGVATERILLEALTRAEIDEPVELSSATALEIAASPFAPSLGGEVTMSLLQQAQAVVQRGLLLVVRGDEVQAAGHLGFEQAPDPDALARSIRLPLGEPSMIAEAVERRETRRGPLDSAAANERLLALLGGPRPTEALVVPMLLREGVGLVFYEDNAPDLQPLGDPGELEWALLAAGLAMERALLDRRLADFESARGYRP